MLRCKEYSHVRIVTVSQDLHRDIAKKFMKDKKARRMHQDKVILEQVLTHRTMGLGALRSTMVHGFHVSGVWTVPQICIFTYSTPRMWVLKGHKGNSF